VPEAPAISPTAHLEERKAQIYENLRDLQFEFRLGQTVRTPTIKRRKVDLQRELAKVMAEIDAVPAVAPAKPARQPVAPKVSNKCPHCGAQFPQPLKFCGECGKAMS